MDAADIRAVVFGWDRTLVDTMDVILAAYREATNEVLGQPFPVTGADIDLVISMPAPASFGMLVDDPQTVEAMLTRHHEAYVRMAPSLIRPVPGAATMLQELRDRGIRTGVVTLKPLRRVAIDADRCGLDGLIDVLITGDGTGAATQPEPVRRCLESLGVEATEAMYVGERVDETIAARAAGIERIAMLDPSGGSLGDPRGTRSLRSVDALVDLVDRDRGALRRPRARPGA